MESTRAKIVLVDDNMSSLTQGRNILKAFYEVYPVPSVTKLFEILENVIPDLILLDVEMPETNGYEAIKKLKADDRFAKIPVIFLTSRGDDNSHLEGLDLGATDYISKPFSAPLLLKRIANQLLIVRQHKDLLADRGNDSDKMVKERTMEILRLQNAVFAAVADLMEFRDHQTSGHTRRIRLYLKTLLAELVRTGTYKKEIADWEMDFFLSSSQLHDVGKIAISDQILNKPGKLTPEEFEKMKNHVAIGVDAIEKIMLDAEEHVFLRHALAIVGTHHEKWDGTGYPTGFKGLSIPLEGRLMAIADVYDALISERPYKPAWSHEDACRIIEAGAGTHFDAVLVDVFKNVEAEFAKIAREIVP